MEPGPARKPALPTVSFAAAGAAAVSLAVVAVPWLRMSVEAPSLRVALETSGSLIAVTTVILLLRQCGLRTRADHLWVMAGLVMLAATSLTVAALVIADVWGPYKARLALGGNFAGTVMLAIAAFAPSRRLRVRRRVVLGGAFALGVALAAIGALLAGVRTAPDFHPELGRIVVQVATAIALLAAAAGLARRDEPLLRWIAAAIVLAGCAKVDYAILPPVGPRNVHLGDILRVVAWGVLLGGVVGEMRRHLRRRAEAALEHERRRLARELHDGVAQELAFIRRRASRLAELPGGEEIVSAADRALEDSRRAIEALVPPASEPLKIALERLGARLATECGVAVQVNVRVTPDLADDVRAELMRIIGEAVRNAAYHGGARLVRVDLAGSPPAVRVIDDGEGFRGGASSGRGVAGYGLIAMRERAEQVGGQFSLESVRGAGTLVQVVLP
jgi:signal transduction histidine kinase